MINKKSLFLCLVIGTIFINSCALTNYTIDEKYTPRLKRSEYAKNFSISLKVNYVPVFQDDVKAIGVKKNGYSIETARIYLNTEVENWILDAFKRELESSGYSINDESKKHQIDVTLYVRQFFVEPWVGFWSATLYGKLSIVAKVVIPGEEVYYYRKFVNYDEATTMAWPDGMFEDRIINVAEKTIPEVIKEIHFLLKNKVGEV